MDKIRNQLKKKEQEVHELKKDLKNAEDRYLTQEFYLPSDSNTRSKKFFLERIRFQDSEIRCASECENGNYWQQEAKWVSADGEKEMEAVIVIYVSNSEDHSGFLDEIFNEKRKNPPDVIEYYVEKYPSHGGEFNVTFKY